jgi:acyl dehydratase
MKYFEDICVSEKRTLGPRAMERNAILAFASQFDRQPYHTDEAAAKDSIYKGLIASGLHTMSVATSIIVDEYLNDKAMVAGLGIDQVRFIRPVRPGDLLSVDIEVQDTMPHPKSDAIGIVRVAVVARNQDGDAVMSGSVDYGFAKKPS